jgi:hypothetical protein
MESFTSKLIFAFKSLAFTPVIWFIEKFIWNDWNLLITVVLFIFLDGVALLMRSLVDKQFAMTQAIRSFGIKTMSISLVVLGIGIFDSALINGQPIDMIRMVNYGFYTMILAFMFMSFLNNVYRIYPWEPIKKILDKLNRLFENEKD